MTTRRETIIIEVRSDGTRVVRRNIDGVDTSLKKADRSLRRFNRSSNLLRNTLVGLGSLLTARQVLRYADAWTSVTNQLRANLPVTANIADETERVLKIAQDTRAPLQEVAKLYAQTSAAALELGASQDQVARLTDITGKSLAIAGTSAAAASGSLLQLTQLLGGTVVQAQEFNSILDGNRPLLQAVASGIDRFGGSVAKLREEVKTGNFTVREFVEGALRGGAQIDERFASAVITVGQATTQLDNAFTQFIGKVNDAEGGTDVLVEALGDLTAFFQDERNIESAKLLGGAIVESLTFALEVIRDTVDGVRDLSEEIARLTVGGNDVPSLTADLVDAGDALIAISGRGEDLGDVFKSIAESAARGFEPAAVTAIEKIERADRRLSVLIGSGSLAELEELAATSSSELDRLTGIFNSLSDVEGARAQEQRENLLTLIDTWQIYGREATEAIEQIRAKGGEAPPEIPVPAEVSTTLGPGTGATGGLSITELDKLEKELARVISRAAPARGAILELARAETILEKATRNNLITQEEEAELLGLLEKQYEDVVDPLSVLNRELDNQLDLLQLTTQERNIANELFKITEQFQRQGITLTQEETAALKDKLTTLQDLANQQAVIDEIQQPQQDFTDRATAVGAGVADGAITEGQAALDTVQNTGGLLDFEGTQTQLDAFVEQHKMAFEQIQILRDQQLIDDQTANQLRAKADLQLAEQRIAGQRKLFSTLSSLATSENKKLAAIGKAAAVTQATIDGILGVQKALASAPPPLNFALAAAVGVTAAANVAQIVSTRRLGGGLNEGQLSRVGEGTRPEVFRSSTTGEQFFIPPERGSVQPLPTLNQQNQATAVTGQQGTADPNADPDAGEQTNVNILFDPEAMRAVTQSQGFTNDLLEIVELNQDEIKSKLGF